MRYTCLSITCDQRTSVTHVWIGNRHVVCNLLPRSVHSLPINPAVCGARLLLICVPKRTRIYIYSVSVDWPPITRQVSVTNSFHRKIWNVLVPLYRPTVEHTAVNYVLEKKIPMYNTISSKIFNVRSKIRLRVQYVRVWEKCFLKMQFPTNSANTNCII